MVYVYTHTFICRSTVVEAIARRLGWGFVTIDTSAFLAGGLGNVAARITEVSTALTEPPSLPPARSPWPGPLPRPQPHPGLSPGPDTDPSTWSQPLPRVLAAPITCSPHHLWLQVFALLMELENVVVLFDEIEEFCLDRSNPQVKSKFVK